jgi:hypothetical protein
MNEREPKKHIKTLKNELFGNILPFWVLEISGIIRCGIEHKK